MQNGKNNKGSEFSILAHYIVVHIIQTISLMWCDIIRYHPDIKENAGGDDLVLSNFNRFTRIAYTLIRLAKLLYTETMHYM